MGKITLSLSDEGEKELRELADEEKRSISKEVEHLVEVYND